MAKYTPAHNPDDTEEKEEDSKEKILDPDALLDDDAVIGDPIVDDIDPLDTTDEEEEDEGLDEFMPEEE